MYILTIVYVRGRDTYVTEHHTFSGSPGSRDEWVDSQAQRVFFELCAKYFPDRDVSDAMEDGRMSNENGDFLQLLTSPRSRG